jgi:hypothetical protein
MSKSLSIIPSKEDAVVPFSVSAELEEALRDGGDEAITTALHEAIKCNDLPFIAWLTKMLNERQSPSREES